MLHIFIGSLCNLIISLIPQSYNLYSSIFTHTTLTGLGLLDIILAHRFLMSVSQWHSQVWKHKRAPFKEKDMKCAPKFTAFPRGSNPWRSATARPSAAQSEACQRYETLSIICTYSIEHEDRVFVSSSECCYIEAKTLPVNRCCHVPQMINQAIVYKFSKMLEYV